MTDSNSRQDAQRESVGEWLSRPYEWRIPVYQRHYAWDAADEAGPIPLFWGTVEEQTKMRLDGGNPNSHYLGVVLVDDKTTLGVPRKITHFDVVDGQQRLTTIQNALLALINTAKQFGCPDTFRSDLGNYLFTDPSKYRPRLKPTNIDNLQYKKVLFDTYEEIPDVGRQNVSRENAEKSKIVVAADYFKATFIKFVKTHPGKEPEEVIRCLMDTLLHGFDFILIVLRDTDNAQRIFESLNNYGTPLTTFELIRNNVFYRAAEKKPGADEELFNQTVWQKLEDPYWEGMSDSNKKNKHTHIESYVFRMLIANMKEEIRFNRNDIFKTYKGFSKQFTSIEEEVKALAQHVDTYQMLDSDPQSINYGIFHYPIWKNREFYPVIFSIVGSDISAEEKLRMIKLLESYVIRRNVCGFETKAYNKHAVSFCKKLNGKINYDSLHGILKELAGESIVFPADNTVLDRCAYASFYRSPFGQYVFQNIEKSMQDEAERGEIGKLTIDHILPQAWENMPQWKTMLGDDEPHVIEPYINTIGNLTLMSQSRNSAKSNDPWQAVRGLLLASPMKLNRDLAQEDVWNVEKIVARSKMLAGEVCKLWPYDIPEK